MTETALTPLEEKRRRKIEEKEKAEVVLEEQIPKPVGYRVLIALPTIEDTFEGGIAKASTSCLWWGWWSIWVTKPIKTKSDFLKARGVNRVIM
jgi:hypothetical protein